MEMTSQTEVTTGMANDREEMLQIYKLLQYVREKNKPQIKNLVQRGVSNLINLTEPKEGLSALSQASIDHDEDLVKFLLSLRAHPDIQDTKGCTPLMLAARSGYYNIVDVLIKNRANVNLTDNEGKGMLFYCISPSKEHALILQMALTCNVNVNNVSNSGKPLLLFACENAKGCEDMCLSILEKGADPNSVDKVTQCSALMGASKAGAVQVVRAILQKGGSPNLVDEEGRCAAHFAAEHGFLEILQVLSAYFAEFNVSTKKGDTPLHFAAAGGFSECCRFLAQRGCNPKLKNLQGQLPRQVATSNGHKSALKELKKAEQIQLKLSKPDAVNPNELWAVTLHDWSCEHETTLRKAFQIFEGLDKPAEKVSLETFVGVLQARKAPVSDENLQMIVKKHDHTHVSVINLNDFFKGLQYLQKAVVIPSYAPKPFKKQKGDNEMKIKSALSLPICTIPPEQICKREDSRLPYYMIEKYRPFTDTGRYSRDRPPAHPIENDSAWHINEPETMYTHISHCVRKGDVESLSLAFLQQVPVDVKDQFYKTPLITACSCGNYQIAKFLISLGADVNAVDQFNWTPLHHACHAGHVGIITMLVQSGAAVNAVTLNGATPLMRAIESCQFSCVEFLINAGANVMAVNKTGQNCIDIAINYGDARIIELLNAKTLPKVKDVKKGHGKKPEPASKPASVQKKMNTQSPGPSVSAAVKKDLRDTLILKNPQFTITSGFNTSDISFVPKTLWGKQITKSFQHSEGEKEKKTLEEKDYSQS